MKTVDQRRVRNKTHSIDYVKLSVPLPEGILMKIRK